ncbi:MAG: hypothetical protein KBG84_16345, partial [Planctomycetes bacterium]|nr:hypothetical protein [Planctomycetota bacterium]
SWRGESVGVRGQPWRASAGAEREFTMNNLQFTIGLHVVPAAFILNCKLGIVNWLWRTAPKR